jgi:inhibitor of KinA
MLDPRPMGDRAILVRLSYPPGLDSHAQLDSAARFSRLQVARAVAYLLKQYHPDWQNTLVNGYDSVLVPFDPQKDSQLALLKWLFELGASPEFVQKILRYLQEGTGNKPRRHRIPVLYNGPDLEEVAGLKNLSVEEVIKIHSSAVYSVYLVGFSAGYAYMGALPEAIDLPRLARPRPKVPKGSVALAAGMTGVYPFDMPGGWRLLGYTPLSIFEPDCDPPLRFMPGDEVQFYPVEKDDLNSFEEIARDLSSSLDKQDAG